MTGYPVNSGGALVSSFQISPVGKLLLDISGNNTLAGIQYIQLFDSVTLPADTAVPLYVVAAQATSFFTKTFMPDGVPFQNGIWVCCSTTAPTKTLGAANCFFEAITR